jgi:hypothetical protein
MQKVIVVFILLASIVSQAKDMVTATKQRTVEVSIREVCKFIVPVTKQPVPVATAQEASAEQK